MECGSAKISLKPLQTPQFKWWLCRALPQLGDWLCSRSLLLPSLFLFLSLSLSLSPPASPCHSFRQTAQCKLQLELLRCVGTLSLKLNISTAELEKLAHACLPYLRSDQPDSLQEACQTCFRHFINLDSDCMWLLLEQVRSEGEETTPPSSLLKPYKLPLCSERERYRTNVNILLEMMVT